jgi:ribosomal protein S8
MFLDNISNMLYFIRNITVNKLYLLTIKHSNTIENMSKTFS